MEFLVGQELPAQRGHGESKTPLAERMVLVAARRERYQHTSRSHVVHTPSASCDL